MITAVHCDVQPCELKLQALNTISEEFYGALSKKETLDQQVVVNAS